MPPPGKDCDRPTAGYWRYAVGAETPYWSRELRAMFGMPLDTPIETADKLALYFEDPAQFRALRAQVRAGAPCGGAELWIRRRTDNARRLMRITNGAEHDDDGLMVAAYGIATDVTDLVLNARSAALSENLLRAFIDHAPAALAMFDLEMRYLRVSPRWLSDYKLEGTEVIGRSHYDVFPEVPDNWREIHQRCLAGAVERCERDRFDRADGSTQWLSWEVRPWRHPAGPIGGILMLTRDISELVRSFEIVERTQRRLQMALEASEMIVWERNRRTGEMTVDGATQKLIGRAPRVQIDESGIWSIIHDDDRAALAGLFEIAVAQRGIVSHEHRAVGLGRGEFWARSIIEPQFDEAGVHIGAIGILKDITHQRSEREALARAREAAEAASRAKSAFVATMSHEIRTPLNGVLGVAQVLARTPLNGEQRHMLDLLLTAGHSLRALVDDAIDLERIEADGVRLREEEFDLGLEVRRASALFAPAALGKGVGFAIETRAIDGMMVRGDALRVRQIVGNLVGNAVKFTDRGGVAVGADAQINAAGQAHAAILVRDTGIGVAPAEHEHIFERFAQGVHDDRGGAGLGLSVARGLARAMGGDVAVSSALNSGASFTFTARLRVGAQIAVAEAAARAPQAEIAALAILVAEDNKLNQIIVDLMLKPLGARVRFVEDGVAACAALDEERFDLVLMDVQMPRMNGVDAIRAIRAREAEQARPRTPILCLTAQERTRGAAAAREAGADGHVSKPIVLEDLLNAIALAIGEGGQRSAA